MHLRHNNCNLIKQLRYYITISRFTITYNIQMLLLAHIISYTLESILLIELINQSAEKILLGQHLREFAIQFSHLIWKIFHSTF